MACMSRDVTIRFRVIVRSLVSLTYLIAATALAQTPPARFANVVTFDSGGIETEFLAVADVNGDGRLDVVVTSARSNNVGVLLGNGDGTFQPVVVYPSGGEWPLKVAIADVNCDGKPDIVEVSELSNSVSVLLGNGDGTFQSPVSYTPGGYGVAVGDLNGDGKPDIVVVDYAGGGVLLGNGDGTFQQAISYDAGGNRVTLADLNNDGKLDVIVSNTQLGTVAVLMGDGDGTLKAPTLYGVGGYYLTAVAIGDVNGDGKSDLVLVNCISPFGCTGVVSVMFGNGDGTFQSPVNYSTGGYWPGSVTIGDVNSDGKPDLVVANNCNDQMCRNQTEGGVAILLGNGDGTFRPAARYSGGGIYTNDVVLADVNRDGVPDLVIANLWTSPENAEGSVGLLINLTKPKSATKTSFTSSLNPSIYGQKVIFTATVTTTGPLPPTGTVVFTEKYFTETITIGSATLNSSGAATLVKSNFNAGLYPITAVYKGDTNNPGSASPVLNQTVRQTTTVASLTSTPNPSTIGQAVTFTAKITSPTVTATGPVTFTLGQTTLGTAQLSGGKATFMTSSLPAGSNVINVTYNGNSNIARSSAAVTQVVQP
jgi:hypothetical protein